MLYHSIDIMITSLQAACVVTINGARVSSCSRLTRPFTAGVSTPGGPMGVVMVCQR